MNFFKNILKVFALVVLVLFIFVILWRAYFSDKKSDEKNTENFEIENRVL